MTHTQVPNNALAVQRTESWLQNVDRRPGDNTRVEIDGVIFDVWPVVVDDPVAKTLTMTFDYNEGGGIFDWAADYAVRGTSVLARRPLALVYEDNRGVELGRNNFFECFPIRYQHFTGFDIDTKGREQVVISYDFASNGNDPLYVLPVVEYFPGTQNMEVPYDLANNGLNVLEIEGVTSGQSPLPADIPVVLSGPGFEIERIAGFDAMGNPDDHSGNNREFPLIIEIGGQELTNISSWKANHDSYLPNQAHLKSGSLIVYDGTDAEAFRWNFFETCPFDITLLPGGRGRVTLYNNNAE